MNFWSKLFNKESDNKKISTSPEKVKAFYNEQNENFLKVYGDIIQAFRTHDVTKLLDYQINTMQLKPGMKVLDAGCGVCGPSVYFAKNSGVEVHAISISEEQIKKANENIINANLVGKVNTYCGDYHKMKEVIKQENFDVVYFLESFGHSPYHSKAIDASWEVLKPGGLLYIKDLFRREPLIAEHAPKIEREIQKINEAYRYNIADLYEILQHVRKNGWIVKAVKTIDLGLQDFENLTISNEFQELTGIAKIESWEDYIFPIDFFELLLVKPHFKLENGLDKYFLQNLMYMQVLGKKEADL